jgi:thiamine biosynthesis lipoprotein
MKHTSRRHFLLGAATLGAGAFAVAGLPRWTEERRLVRRSLPLMGTLAELAIVTTNGLTEADAQAALDAAFAELDRTETLMSRFRATSDVGRANRAAGRPTAIDERTRFVLEAAHRWSEASAGRFDPCLGSLEELWDVTHREVPPSQAEVSTARAHSNWRDLDLSSAGLTLRQGAKLDLGGIAKGFGIDEARRALEAHGVTSALINVGGDLYAMGQSEDGDAWKVGVRDPLDPTRITTTLAVTDGAVATSGDYERFFDFEGQRYHHILGADGYPISRPGRHSKTISAPDCLTADAAATATFGLETEASEALIARIAPAARVRA